MTVIPLKILPVYFPEVCAGRKRAELRKDDRGFRVGDNLMLREWTGKEYTGRRVIVRVTHILRNAPEYGLQDGFCILSIEPDVLANYAEIPLMCLEEDSRGVSQT